MGDGDFSYTVGLIKHLRRYHIQPGEKKDSENAINAQTDNSDSSANTNTTVLHLTTTSYESYDLLTTRYKNAAEHIAWLKEQGINVQHEIDATKLPSYSNLTPHVPAAYSNSHDNTTANNTAKNAPFHFDVIIFHFPHTGGKSKIHTNRTLLTQFFAAGRAILTPKGHIQCSLIKGQGGTHRDPEKRKYGDSWQVTEMGHNAGLLLAHIFPYVPWLYEGYNSKGFRSQDLGFHNECDALTHVFIHDAANPIQNDDNSSSMLTENHSAPSLPSYIDPDHSRFLPFIPAGLRQKVLRSLLTTEHHPLHTLNHYIQSYLASCPTSTLACADSAVILTSLPFAIQPLSSPIVYESALTVFNRINWSQPGVSAMYRIDRAYYLDDCMGVHCLRTDMGCALAKHFVVAPDFTCSPVFTGDVYRRSAINALQWSLQQPEDYATFTFDIPAARPAPAAQPNQAAPLKATAAANDQPTTAAAKQSGTAKAQSGPPASKKQSASKNQPAVKAAATQPAPKKQPAPITPPTSVLLDTIPEYVKPTDTPQDAPPAVPPVMRHMDTGYPVFHQQCITRLFTKQRSSLLQAPDVTALLLNDLSSFLTHLFSQLLPDCPTRVVATPFSEQERLRFGCYTPSIECSLTHEIHLTYNKREHVVARCGILYTVPKSDVFGWYAEYMLDKLAMLCYQIVDLRWLWSTNPHFLGQFAWRAKQQQTSAQPTSAAMQVEEIAAFRPPHFIPFSLSNPCWLRDNSFWIQSTYFERIYLDVLHNTCISVSEQNSQLGEELLSMDCIPLVWKREIWRHPHYSNAISFNYRLYFHAVDRTLSLSLIQRLQKALQQSIEATRTVARKEKDELAIKAGRSIGLPTPSSSPAASFTVFHHENVLPTALFQSSQHNRQISE